MNLSWGILTDPQRRALLLLKQLPRCVLPAELSEQLRTLGLVEHYGIGVAISTLGEAVLPPTVH